MTNIAKISSYISQKEVIRNQKEVIEKSIDDLGIGEELYSKLLQLNPDGEIPKDILTEIDIPMPEETPFQPDRFRQVRNFTELESGIVYFYDSCKTAQDTKNVILTDKDKPILMMATNRKTMMPIVVSVLDEDVELEDIKQEWTKVLEDNHIYPAFEVVSYEETDTNEAVALLDSIIISSKNVLNIKELGMPLTRLYNDRVVTRGAILYYHTVKEYKGSERLLSDYTKMKVTFARDLIEFISSADRSLNEIDRLGKELEETYSEFNKDMDSLVSGVNGSTSLLPARALKDEKEKLEKAVEEGKELTEEEKLSLDKINLTIKYMEGTLDLDYLFDVYMSDEVRRKKTLYEFKNKVLGNDVITRYAKKMTKFEIPLFNKVRGIERELDSKYHDLDDFFTFTVIRAYSYIKEPTLQEKIFSIQLTAYIRDFILTGRELTDAELRYKNKLIKTIENFLDLFLEDEETL